MAKSLPLILHCAILLIGSYALYVFIFDVEPNGCEMTYMYEMPKYIKLDLKNSLIEKYPVYNLYYYTEGNRELGYHGIPALFVPGNGGSYKQVRSVGSVALTMSDSFQNMKYDFFALDFNEELSGLSGILLKRQTNFTRSCIDHILKKLYKGKHPSLVIIGHSMGGFIARSLFSLDGFDQSSVSVVITQATPHVKPVLLLDETMRQLYKDTNEAWRNMSDRIYDDIEEGKDPLRVTLVSTGGGDRDHMVRTDLTSLSRVGHYHNAIWTSTFSMPLAWVSTDHLCHVWCKQVVLATVRALYDIVDKSTKRVLTNSTLRFEVMRHHFLTSGGSFNPGRIPQMRVNPAFKWEVVDTPWKLNGKISNSYYAVIDITQIKENYEIIILSNAKIAKWAGTCRPSIPLMNCSHLETISSSLLLLPNPQGSPYKVMHLNHEMLKLQRYLVLVLPASTYSHAFVDVRGPRERAYKIEFGSLSNLSSSSSSSPPSSLLALSSYLWFWNHHELVLSGPSYHSISFMDMYHLEVYLVKVTHLQCKDEKNEGSSVMMFDDGRGEYPSYVTMRKGNTTRMKIKLVSRSLDRKVRQMFPNLSPKLKFYLTTDCTFRVEISPSVVGVLGQAARFYFTYLPSFATVAIILQFGNHHSKLRFISIYIIPIIMFAAFTLIMNSIGFDQLIKIRHDLFFCESYDWLMLLFLFLFSMSLSRLLAAMTSLFCSVMGSIVNSLIKTSCRDMLSGLTLIFLCLSPLISYYTCGSVVLMMAQIVYLGMAIGQHLKVKEGKLATSSPSILIFLVSLIHFLFNSPTLIVWFKDIHNFHLLNDDPSFIHSCVSSFVLCWFKLSGYIDRLSRQSRGSRVIRPACYILSPFVILYGVTSLYRIAFFLDIFFVVLSLHSIVSFLSTDYDGSDDEDGDSDDGSCDVGSGYDDDEFMSKKDN